MVQMQTVGGTRGHRMLSRIVAMVSEPSTSGRVNASILDATTNDDRHSMIDSRKYLSLICRHDAAVTAIDAATNAFDWTMRMFSPMMLDRPHFDDDAGDRRDCFDHDCETVFATMTTTACVPDLDCCHLVPLLDASSPSHPRVYPSPRLSL